MEGTGKEIDKVRNYSILKRSLSNNYSRTLEMLLEPEAQLQILRKQKANIVPAEILYNHGILERKTKVYEHYDEVPIKIHNDNSQVELGFISSQSYNQLIKSAYTYLHIGLVMINISILHRKNMGTKCMVALVDSSCNNLKQAIISTAEVDLNNGGGLIYIVPELQMLVKDFFKNIRVIIKTKGYNLTSDRSNLVITKVLVGRLSNSTTCKYKLEVGKTIDYLTTKGVKALPPPEISTKLLEGTEWNIELALSSTKPDRVSYYEDSRKSISLRFSDYREIKNTEEIEEIVEEEIGEEIRMMRELDLEDLEPVYDSYSDEDSDYEQDSIELLKRFNEYVGYLPEKVETLDVVDKELLKCQYLKNYSIDKLRKFGEIVKRDGIVIDGMKSEVLIDIYNEAERLASHQESSSVTYPLANPNYIPNIEIEDPIYEPTTHNINIDSVFNNRIRQGMPNLPETTLPLPRASDNGTELRLGLYHPQQWPEVIDLWEKSILVAFAGRRFSGANARIEFVKSLMGRIVSGIFQQWQQSFPESYERLLAVSTEPKNITSQVRQIILGIDPMRGQTDLQNQAVRDLDRLIIEDLKHLPKFSAEYINLAWITGKYFSIEICEKYFNKLPKPVGDSIRQAWLQKYPDNFIGLLPRIYFTFEYLKEQCIQNVAQRQMQDFGFCNKSIYVPGYYNKGRARLRKAANYRKGRKQEHHVKKFKKHKPSNIKCKCFKCGEIGHFAYQCTSRMVRQDRVNVYDELGLPDRLDIVSAEEDENPSDSDVCSIELEPDVQNIDDQFSIHLQTFKEAVNPELFRMMNENQWSLSSLMYKDNGCIHNFSKCSVHIKDRCEVCIIYPPEGYKYNCSKCDLFLCYFCASSKYGVTVHKEEEAVSSNNIEIPLEAYQCASLSIQDMLFIFRQLKEKIDKTNDYMALITELQLEQSRLRQEIFDLKNDLELNKKGKQKIGIHIEENINKSIENIEVEELNSMNCNSIPLVKINNLINFIVTLEFEDGFKTKLRAMLDTGATRNYVKNTVIPKKYQIVADKPGTAATAGGHALIMREYLKGCSIIIGGQKYSMPYTWCIPPEDDDIDITLGMSFVRSQQGGIAIFNDSVKIFKRIGSINPSNSTFRNDNDNRFLLIEEENEYVSEVLEVICSTRDEPYEGISPEFLNTYQSYVIPRLEDLKKEGYVGNNPLKHWDKNRIECKLDIINPELIIKDKPPKANPQELLEYEHHVRNLLEKKLLRPSHSIHRTSAFIVMKHSEIARGESRMVFNYKRLNDNTNIDPYPIPDKDILLQKIKNKFIYSKFDLKSGFWQIKMHENDIPWTAIVVPPCNIETVHYEWLVMPFGLKNAPQIFQRKMDSIFGKYDFIVCYIDDVLVFSNTIADHKRHLGIFLDLCVKNGLILSPTKMSIGKNNISFLGLEIKSGKVMLQPHIIQSILTFPEDFKDIKTIQKFLGILNYARKYIPNLHKLVAPLYNKIKLKGERRMNQEDYNLIRKIKEVVSKLEPLKLPDSTDYLIVETDGSLEGWGAILKCKKDKYAPINSEEICAYTSGKYTTNVSTIDAEILAVINALEKFKIFLICQKEFTLRTDCQAIVSFYKSMKDNKLSKNRWLKFVDYIVGNGFRVTIEHIKGNKNSAADILSRIIHQ